MIITSATVGPFEENCYLVVDDSIATRPAVLIDPGDEAPRLLALVVAARATLTAIWLTHAHLDHIGGIAGVKAVYDVPIFLHPLDQPLYAAGAKQAAAYGVPFVSPPPADGVLCDGQTLDVGTLGFQVLHVPGHAPGHVAFVAEGVVFGGDCLFAGSIGRTDLPGCNPHDLERSLERLVALPPPTVVWPGHGPATTVGAELRTNPFLRQLSGLAR